LGKDISLPRKVLARAEGEARQGEGYLLWKPLFGAGGALVGRVTERLGGVGILLYVRRQATAFWKVKKVGGKREASSFYKRHRRFKESASLPGKRRKALSSEKMCGQYLLRRTSPDRENGKRVREGGECAFSGGEKMFCFRGKQRRKNRDYLSRRFARHRRGFTWAGIQKKRKGRKSWGGGGIFGDRLIGE